MELSALLASLVLAVAASALLALVILLLVRVSRRITARVRRLAAAAAPRLRVGGLALLRSDQLYRAATVSVRVVAWLVGLAAVYIYLTFVLTTFPWTRSWGHALGHFLVETLTSLGLAVLGAIPNLFVVALIFVATRFVVVLARSIIGAAAQSRIVLLGIHPDTAAPTRRIVTVLLWLFAVALAYPYLPGSSSEAFKGVSVFVGLLFTIGSAGLVGQAMSGLVLMYSRSFKVGDFIEAGGVQGTVVELGLLSTRLKTPKNEYVSMPNNVVVGRAVTDYSAAGEHDQRLFIYSSVTIGYDTPWRRVHELLIAAARRSDGVLADPAPFVLQRALDDSYVEYQVNAAIDSARAAELPWLYSTLHGSIQDAFSEAGVEILSPTYHAARDGNASTVPGDRRQEGKPRAFRVEIAPT